jgi:hypothetical protein
MSWARTQVDRNGCGLTGTGLTPQANPKLTELSINVARLVEKGDDSDEGYKTDAF